MFHRPDSKPPIVQLTRNLRKTLLQGNPWVYKEALKFGPDRVCLVQLNDQKNQFLAWGFYDPRSPLALRVLSTDRRSPTAMLLVQRLQKAWDLRHPLTASGTNVYRLVNGEGDGFPGLVVDVYDHVAVVQFDGPGPEAFWDGDPIASTLLDHSQIQSVYFKARGRAPGLIVGAPIPEQALTVVELGIQSLVDIRRGQKTGLFIDQRDNRGFVRQMSRDKHVANLFSYTGGFSVAAGMGGARSVTSVDLSAEALKTCKANWELNGIDQHRHSTQKLDLFKDLEDWDQMFDLVVCDPPSLAPSEAVKERALKQYLHTFSQAAKKVKPGGQLALSSCSSHVNFEEFSDLVDLSLSKARRSARVLRVGGQGLDHPYPQACPQLRYLKFYFLQLLE